MPRASSTASANAMTIKGISCLGFSRCGRDRSPDPQVPQK